MEITLLDGAKLRDMLLSGAHLLEQNKEHVDALNVFPVPDGDTGTNMSLTINSAVNEVKRVNTDHIGSVAEAAARGSLMGARGNSGVILSQLIRGIAKELKHMETVDPEAFAKALENGYKTASEAVMKPMEGTILTVAREAARAAVKASLKSSGFACLFEQVLEKANATLQKTPEMLPVLKQAGVVDAGAKGWVLILEGMYQGLTGEVELRLDAVEPTYQRVLELTPEIEFAYCTELLIIGTSANLGQVRKSLESLGDSLLVVGEEQAVKVHIHSNHPGQVLERCLGFGQLENIKIENMVFQHAAQHESNEQRKPFGLLAVSSGEGLKDLFRSLGVEQVVSGGQTNNPSTEDLVRAIKFLTAEVVYVFPNNGNVILTADQAAKLVDTRVIVIPTKSIPAGISALIAFQPEKDPDTNLARMLRAVESVKTAEVTYAVRDTSVAAQEIKKNDLIGIVDDKILVVGNDLGDVTARLIEKVVDEESEIVTIYVGQDTSETIAQEIIRKLEAKLPGIEFECHFGGQPLYYFLVSVE